ncbi:MAG: hypothetical protein ABSG63_07610 [Spirochaetia bacterium]|jgi:hypothetical protein
MYNFELYSGTLDLKEGSEKYRPFRDAVAAALEKAPLPAAAPVDKSGT